MTDPLFLRLQTIALTAALAVACIFGAFPGLDLAVSALFTDGQGRFAFTASALARGMNDSLRIGLQVVFAAVCIALLVASVLRLRLAPGYRIWLFVVAVVAAGPGLIVNGLLKSTVGRARPDQVIEFGGSKLFTPMLQISDQCARNCSFSSGEVAMTSTMVFAALALAWPRLARRGRIAAALAGGGMICLSTVLRVGLGRHFLSDALSSVAISALVVLAGYRLFGLATARIRGAGAARPQDFRDIAARP